MTDEFKGDTGLKEDFDGTITSPEFTQGQRGNWGLHFTIQADDGEEVERTYSVGGADKGWTSYDGGETIEGPSAKSRFHVRSSMQQFINDALAAGAETELRKRSAKLDNRGPFHAALWEGLRFHFDVTQRPQGVRDSTTGEWSDKLTDVIIPTKYLVWGERPPPRPTPAKSTAQGSAQSRAQGDAGSKAGSTAQGGTPSGNGSDITEMDLTALTGLAKAANDHGHFADLVMDAQDSAGEPFLKNKTVMKKIGQEEFYKGLLV